MTDRDRLFLQHVLSAIEAIDSFTAEGRDGFMTDRKTQLTARETAVPWRQIAGTRDRLIHAYFNVDLDAVWSMVEQDLPALRSDVQRIIAGQPSPRPPG